MSEVVSIAIGFVLTTLVGGWWASRLQGRSWDRQNRLQLEEEERKRAAEVCRELSALLDKRLYRMLRLSSAIAGYADGSVKPELLEARWKDYDDILYQWNDALNTNLAIIGSHFGDGARNHLERLYEDFRRVGSELERGLRSVRRGEAIPDFDGINGEFEGWHSGSLNSRVYLFVFTMMSQLREGLVGRAAPDKMPTPAAAPTVY